tara:strand:+ start:1099 stop:1548 length:450 start_codon:yes stop_codon:yes gene_type:complete
MTRLMDKAIIGLNKFISKLDKNNYLSLVTFDSGMKYIIKAEKIEFITKIKKSVFTMGFSTMLYDTIINVIREFIESDIKTQLHIITDGCDTISQASKEKVEYCCKQITTTKQWNITYYNPVNIDFKLENIKNITYDLNDIDNLLGNMSI